jgi:hypothetical protein
MRALVLALIFSTALIGAPALAQTSPAAPAIGPADTEKVKQVFVYGDDPCPKSEGDEIVVCARMPDNERYRIPKDLRTDPNDAKVQSWGNRARSIEYVGASGTDSCSPVGGGGFTGCFAQIARAAKEERKAMLGSATWADAVEKARRERLGNLDAESEAIEKDVKAEEAEKQQQTAPKP